MNVQKGISREQMWMISLDMEISEDSVVRLIDLFVGHIDLDKLVLQRLKLKKKAVLSIRQMICVSFIITDISIVYDLPEGLLQSAAVMLNCGGCYIS
jgi:hypothetical protein